LVVLQVVHTEELVQVRHPAIEEAHETHADPLRT
jgi:hypothetical protein